MVRVKRGKIAHKRRKYVLKYTKGFRWGRKAKYRAAKEALLHAWTHAFRGRKEKKGDFRRMWQIQINAAVRQHNLTYGKFMHSLKKKHIGLDRKMLAQLARERPEIFEKIMEEAQK